jgi:hypothetical protein
MLSKNQGVNRLRDEILKGEKKSELVLIFIKREI